jgi:L-rhamnose mutarotase
MDYEAKLFVMVEGKNKKEAYKNLVEKMKATGIKNYSVIMENAVAKEIEVGFEILIREKLTEQEFWKYYISWKDIEEATNEMENWDLETKRIAINELLDMFPR